MTTLNMNIGHEAFLKKINLITQPEVLRIESGKDVNFCFDAVIKLVICLRNTY